MILPAICIILSRDPELVRRAKAYLRPMAEVRWVEDPDRIDIVLRQASPAVLLVDLRARASGDLLRELSKNESEVLLIALGTPRSDPFREAEQAGIYATEDVNLERRSFQALFGRAFDHLRVRQEVRDLRDEMSAAASSQTSRRRSDPVAAGTGSTSPLLHFARVFRRTQNIDALLESIVEGVADAAGVARAGLFSQDREKGAFRLRAGLRCLPETGAMEFSERDPLVRWFERNVRLVGRTQLPQFEDRAERAVLRRALDSFAAEVIVPLYRAGRLLGWLFFGHRQTGSVFEPEQLESLMALGEHISTVIENALLNDQLLLQKTLAEALLKSIPPGVIATDERGVVRWFNPAVERMLGLPAGKVTGKPIEAAGSKLAALFREALEANEELERRRWIDEKTHRSVSVEIRRLGSAENALGAVALIQDLTAEEALQEKRDLSDRAAFWSDLAASMSHEIRNPLVAIKTYAQLLPERFDDPDFRREFSDIVVHEINRLDSIVSQINNFAHPPELAFKAIDVRVPVRKALEMARPNFQRNGEISVETSLEADLPRVLGDEAALTEAFVHLVTNAAEAASEQQKPHITLSATAIRDGDYESGVLVTVADNGGGIDPEIKDKIFSPFCTTKPRGIGLGLPIVKRTVFDHHGRVKIDSGSQGTLVSVILPASANGH
ncbi:MAG TPA: ATP-binding protein [Chthoniobacteraceae bacterium]